VIIVLKHGDIQKNAERMIPSPTKWILPTISCPSLFYGREMRCPKWSEAYLDLNTEGWRESGNGKGFSQAYMESSGSIYAPPTWIIPASSSSAAESAPLSGVIGDPRILQMRKWLTDDF